MGGDINHHSAHLLNAANLTNSWGQTRSQDRHSPRLPDVGHTELANLLANRPSRNFQNSTGFPDKLREPSRTYAMQPKNACTPRYTPRHTPRQSSDPSIIFNHHHSNLPEGLHTSK